MVRRLLLYVSTACLLAVPVAAQAVPLTLGVDGALGTAGGGPGADGDYLIAFAIYDSEKGTTPAWKEGPFKVTVAKGFFAASLGQQTPLSAQTLAALPQAWLGVTVGTDPELPRKQLLSVPFSLRAAVAEGLDCSGCVGIGQIDPKALASYAKVGDLAPYAKSSDLGKYAQSADLADYVKAASLAAVAASGSYKDLKDVPKFADVATTGAYADLAGLPVLAKVNSACGTGLVVKGIKADGSLDCATSAVTAKDLPADGLNEVSGNLLTTQFQELAASTKTPLDIPDGIATGVSDAIEVPDFGIAESFSVTVNVTNSDISKLRITLYAPGGATYKLHEQSGSGTSLKATFKAGDKLVEGDLSTWIGQNPKGLWSLAVADLAGTLGNKDGKLNSWSIATGVKSTKKVGVGGALVFYSAKDPPVPCDANNFGATYGNPGTQALYVCNGMSWAALYLALPGTKENPALSCKDLVAKVPNANSGPYWLDIDGVGGSAPFEVYCEMTILGGGWTLLFNLDSSDNLRHAWADTGFWHGSGTEGSAANGLTAGSKSSAYGLLGGKELLVSAHDNGTLMAWGAYDLLALYQNVPMLTLVKGSEATVTAPRKAQSGTTGVVWNSKRSQSRYGDPFVDKQNGEAVVVNRAAGWNAQVNTNRLATTATNAEYPHTQGGLGGSHIYGGWGQNYESSPIASYCDITNLYGNGANLEANGQGNTMAGGPGTCGDPGLFKYLPVDLAVWVR
ncbi:MAG: proprotein convertase P-domain-containing protein [Deltaproteobacteria bacterium]|nr:proprotein convertase P-domain-containing protein [Deltaproteobacteria bacterium]